MTIQSLNHDKGDYESASPMRECPHCHAEYPDDVTACLLDRTLLDGGGAAAEVALFCLQRGFRGSKREV
jgi:hypothetical protein